MSATMGLQQEWQLPALQVVPRSGLAQSSQRSDAIAEGMHG